MELIEQILEFFRYGILILVCVGAGFFGGQSYVYQQFFTPDKIEMAALVHSMTAIPEKPVN